MSFNKSVKEVAKEDIQVFKIVEKICNKLLSFYERFEYKIGESYSTDIGNVEYWGNSCIINEGFHSYSENCKIRKNSNLLVIKHEHLKTLDTISLNECVEKLIRMDCIIPKGAEYYLNTDGEYVSNQLKIINIQEILYVLVLRKT